MTQIKINLIQLKRYQCLEKQNRERGAITMVETLIAIATGVAILAVVFAGLPALTAAKNSSIGINGLNQITTVIRMTFNVRNNFQGLSNEFVMNLAGFPKHFISGDKLIHPWGGEIIVSDGTNAHEFTITYSDLNSETCTSIVASTIDLAEGITVGSSNVYSDKFNYNNNITTSNIASVCSTNDSNDVTWTFRG